MSYPGRLLAAAAQPRIFKASLRTALVVGLILDAVNQGSALIDGAPLAFGQLLLNFAVPFCMSIYSAARHEVSQQDARPRYRERDHAS